MLQAQPSYKGIDVKNGGVIRGTARLKGDIPKIERYEITKNSEACGTVRTSQRLQVAPNRGVKNAIVYLESITCGKKFSTDVKIELRQENCEYIPHVTIVPLGEGIEIVNNDPILHNIHAYGVQPGTPSFFNIAQPIKGQRTMISHKQLKEPGLITVTCDAGHPWMSGYIMIAGNPYYALTDDNGKFELAEVPPGSYKITMWHEGFQVTKKEIENGKVKRYCYEDPYETSSSVTVSENQESIVDFEFTKR